MSNDIVPTKYDKQKKVEQIVSSGVTVKEKGLGEKLAETFLSEDVANVKTYILKDVIIPAIKDTIVDIVKNGIEMMFYGDTKVSRKGSSNGTYVSYSSYYQPTSRSRSESSRSSSNTKSNTKDFIFESRGEAEKVLDTLTDIISEYQVASVADLCQLVGVTGEWTDNKWGWYDLTSASVKRIHGGYMLDLPKPTHIE